MSKNRNRAKLKKDNLHLNHIFIIILKNLKSGLRLSLQSMKERILLLQLIFHMRTIHLDLAGTLQILFDLQYQ